MATLRNCVLGKLVILVVVFLSFAQIDVVSAVKVRGRGGRGRRLGKIATGVAVGAGTAYVARKAVKALKPRGFGRDNDWDDDDDDWYYNRYRRRRGSSMSQCRNGRVFNEITYEGEFYCPRYGDPDSYVGCCRDNNGYGYCCPWYESGSYLGLLIGMLVLLVIIIAACAACYCCFCKKGSKRLSNFKNPFGGGGGGRDRGAAYYNAPQQSATAYPPAPQQQNYPPYPQGNQYQPAYPPSYPPTQQGQYPVAQPYYK